MTAVELLPPGTGPHDERWHELRRQGITASEIAIVMGISPYGSPFSLYWQKANDWRWEGNDLTSAGRHLEDAIADWWMAERDPLENLQARPAGLYAHHDRPWQLATPDRLLYLACPECGGSGKPDGPGYYCAECLGSRPGTVGYPLALIECKWVAYSWDGWGEPGTDEVPVHYRAQALWQLDVMGVDEVHFAALGPGGFRSYVVRYDEADLELMRKAGEDFVRRLREGDPPPLDSHTATLGALKKLYPAVGEGEVEVPPDLAIRFREARAQQELASSSTAKVEAEIRALLGDSYARATIQGRLLASRSVFRQDRIDAKRLRAERPDIAAEYTVTSTVDRLNPGRAKS